MFKIIGKNTEPKSRQRSIRIPVTQYDAIERLAKESKVAFNRVIVEMIDYCLTDKKNK